MGGEEQEGEEEEEEEDSAEGNAAAAGGSSSSTDPGDADGERPLHKLPALVLWEESTKTLAATLLPSKSLKDFTYAVDWAVTVLDHDWGLAGEELTLKGDGEPALRTLCKAPAEARKGRTLLEVSPPGD